MVPWDDEAGANEQHCDCDYWAEEQTHVHKVGIMMISRVMILTYCQNQDAHDGYDRDIYLHH